MTVLTNGNDKIDTTKCVEFDDLRHQCVDGLTVFTKEDDGYMNAISSRSFILNKPTNLDRYPEAVVVATTTIGVQATVRFCQSNNLRVSVRTGGHNWFSCWLQGKGSVLLDVGDLNHVDNIEIQQHDNDNNDEKTATVVAGPGALQLNRQLNSTEWFFPTGHCPQVPLGGYILGGGYGLGFQKYGLASSLVVGMEVVLPSTGEIRWIYDDDTDSQSRALMALMRGSYHYFPAVITKYKLRLRKAPKCVLPQTFMFPLDDWRDVIRYGRDIAHRGDEDSMNIETTVVFCYASDEIYQTTGNKKVVLLSLMVWSDEDYAATQQLLQKYTSNIKGLLVPSKPDEPMDPKSVADSFAGLYPEGRYLSEASFGDSSVLDLSDDDICNTMVSPLANMWMSDEVPEGPSSHSLVVLINKNLRSVNGCDLATMDVPAIELMSYAIYQDKSKDGVYREAIQRSLAGTKQSTNCRTALNEGNILNDNDFFFDGRHEAVTKDIQAIDPHGMFRKIQ